MKVAVEKLEWKTRGRRDDNTVARRMVYETRCGLYRVVHSQLAYGTDAGRFYAERATWMPVSGEKAWASVSANPHRTREGAAKACERHYRETQG
jgi:hypothetical protein